MRGIFLYSLARNMGIFLYCFFDDKTIYSMKGFMAHQAVDEVPSFRKVRAVNLGGWLVIEKWINPSLFDGIVNGDLLDGTQIQLKSAKLGTYLTAEGGGGQKIVANRASASGWETFKLWRVSSTQYQLRVYSNQFITAENGGGDVVATRTTPDTWETFTIERMSQSPNRVHIRSINGMYLQVKSTSQVTADYSEEPGWSRDNPAVFDMNVNTALGGEYQLANGHGSNAPQVFKNHWDTFIISDDFRNLASIGINAVRIPVGWWIMYENNPPRPFVAGSLQALDNAFTWGRTKKIQIIVDLHAAQGSQNPWEHAGSRDGVSEWTQSDNIKQTLNAIEFLASRYGSNPALLGIELLNEPAAGNVPLSVVSSYYKNGYQIVRKYSSTAYVIICERIGSDPSELVGLMKSSDGYSNVVLDVHYYNLFDESFNRFSAQDNINFVYHQRRQAVESLNSAGGAAVFVGEWTNEWAINGTSDADYQRFAAAQLSVFGRASFGWSYWCLKNENLHWDFEKSVGKYLLRSSNGDWPS